MMLKDDKRKMATIIVSKMKDGQESYRPKLTEAGAENSHEDEMYMIADDVLRSIQDGDVRTFKRSLEAFIECCMGEDKKSESMHEDDSSEY